jgi:eukaryotic-like serine/threonine-protein kinase
LNDPELERLYNLSDDFIDLFDEAQDDALDEILSDPQLETLQKTDQRYTQADFIDGGGMKKIHSYSDSVTGRTIAMATMNRYEHKKELAYFINEARITALLEHPNIVPVYDIGTTPDKKPYFTMKKLGGENLRAVLNRLQANDPETLDRYPLTEILDIFLKVCDAISYAHSRGIVHLDLKPANIQLDEYGQVQVCDWGLARKLTNSNQVSETLKENNDALYEGRYISQTLDGACKGSPGFMAPEQISDDFGLRSIQTDIYSLGALLYTLLTYHEALEGDSAKKLMDDTIQGNIIPITAQIKHVDMSLVAVVQKAMKLHPKNRYDSVQNLANDLRAFRNGFATRAEDASLSKRLILTFKRHRNLSISALVMLSLVITFILSINQEKNRARKSERSALDLANKLELEKIQKQQFNIETAPKLLTTAQLLYKDGAYSEALTHTITALTLDPNLEEARLLHAMLLLGELQASKALQILLTITPTQQTKYLIETAQQIQSIPSQYKSPKLNQLYPVYRKLYQGPYSLRLNLHNHLMVKISFSYPENERIAFAERFYQDNAKDTPFTFNLIKNDNSYKLSLKGNKGTSTLRELNNLPITELDLSYSAFANLKHLQRLPLKKLNLAHSKTSDLLQLVPCKSLEVLNIADSKVHNLFPISHTSIHTLILGHQVIGLQPLKSCKSLKRLIIPPGVYAKEKLDYFGLTHLVEYSD